VLVFGAVRYALVFEFVEIGLCRVGSWYVMVCWCELVCGGICWYVLVCVGVSGTCLYVLVCVGMLVCVGLNLLILLVRVVICKYLFVYVGMCWYMLVYVGKCWYMLVCVAM